MLSAGVVSRAGAALGDLALAKRAVESVCSDEVRSASRAGPVREAARELSGLRARGPRLALVTKAAGFPGLLGIFASRDGLSTDHRQLRFASPLTNSSNTTTYAKALSAAWVRRLPARAILSLWANLCGEGAVFGHRQLNCMILFRINDSPVRFVWEDPLTVVLSPPEESAVPTSRER